MCVVRQGDLLAAQLNEYFANQTIMSLSIGLAANRVVLPPAFRAAKVADAQRAVVGPRAHARRVRNYSTSLAACRS